MGCEEVRGSTGRDEGRQLTSYHELCAFPKMFCRPRTARHNLLFAMIRDTTMSEVFYLLCPKTTVVGRPGTRRSSLLATEVFWMIQSRVKDHGIRLLSQRGQAWVGLHCFACLAPAICKNHATRGSWYILYGKRRLCLEEQSASR